LAARFARLGIREEDLEESFVQSGGKGGQNVNKVATCVVLVHRPSGMAVKCQRERTQGANRLIARAMLADKIEEERLGRESARAQAAEKIRRQKRRRFWRRIFSASACARVFLPKISRSIFSTRSLLARKRFSAWERSSWHFTRTPEGRCRSTTQVDTLLTFWPPLPPERTNCSSRSSARMPRRSRRSSRARTFPGETGNIVTT